MPGSWDSGLKRLVKAVPEDFVALLAPEAECVKNIPVEAELHHQDIHADLLYEISERGKLLLLHLELQSTSEVAVMAERLLEYNVLARRQYKRPVRSYVIYLRDDGRVASSPLIWKVPVGRAGEETVLIFHFQSIKVWEMKAEDVIRSGLPGLLPLLPLTYNGGRHEVVESMIDGLLAHDQLKLLWIAFSIAALVFKDPSEKEWLERRFAMYEDILTESWVYQETVQKGLEKGLQQGLQQGRQEGRQETLTQVLLNIVEARFPTLLPQAKALVEHAYDPLTLQHVIIMLTLAQSTEEANQSLSNGASAS
ncbi:MAG: hypothetical protein M3Y81_02685 [Chloroflexota bacterium]|nr:hypothetical protein [Chloroflexota bacterium]